MIKIEVRMKTIMVMNLTNTLFSPKQNGSQKYIV